MKDWSKAGPWTAKLTNLSELQIDAPTQRELINSRAATTTNSLTDNNSDSLSMSTHPASIAQSRVLVLLLNA